MEVGEPEFLGDAGLMARSRLEPDCFAVVFDRHFVTIHRYLARRVGTTVADDLAGEVFRVAFERRGSFDQQRESARPWLYGIATNLIHGERRREERWLRALQRAAVAACVPTVPDVFERADERMDAEAGSRDVASAVGQLAEVDRDALILFAVEGLTYGEIATALAIPVGTVRSRISRGRRRLRELLDVSRQQVSDWPEAEGRRNG